MLISSALCLVFLFYYPCDAMLSRVAAREQRVLPSVTRRYCVKTKKASVMISSPSGSHRILVCLCQISSQNPKGVTPS